MQTPSGGISCLADRGSPEDRRGAALAFGARGLFTENSPQARSSKFAGNEFPEVLIIRYAAFNYLALSQEEIW